jgi:peptidoglycan/LPS O-acetylase OafA/YrhL
MTGDMPTRPSSDSSTRICAPSTQDSGRRVRGDIEGLRALAVLSVLINHAFPNVLPGGFAGVDIFFVISGYLIGGHLLQDIQAGRMSILGFYAKRARRIFPALALVLLCTWGIGWLWLSAPEFSALGQQIVAAVFFSNNILLWTQSGYFDTAALDKPLLHLWSLGIEEQFYLLVPAMLWLSSTGAAGSIRWVARLGAASLLTTIVVSNLDLVASFYLLHARFWELAVGVTLAQVMLRTREKVPRHIGAPAVSKRDIREVQLFSWAILFSAVLVLGASDAPWEPNTLLKYLGLALATIGAVGTAFLADRRACPQAWNAMMQWWLHHSDIIEAAISAASMLLIGASFAWLTSSNWPGAQTLLPVLGTVLVIAARPTALLNSLLARKPMAFLGGISYPLYLWHWPAIVFFRLVNPNPRAVEFMIPLTVSFVLAWLTKALVEDPVRFGRLAGVTFRRPPFWPLPASLLIAGLLGSLVVDGDGVPSRFPPRLRAVAEWSADNPDVAWRTGRCYFHPGVTLEFSSECTPNKRPGVPLVLLWGDSHAAELYSGMAAIQSTMAIDIAQWTVAGCPPTVKIYHEGSHCAEWSARAITRLAKLKPDMIVLAGAWERYSEQGPYQEQIIETLSDTVRHLKELGIRQIVVIGPGPLWTNSLPVDLFRFMVRTRANDIPDRLGKVSDTIWNLDSAMAAQAAADQVQYVSLLSFFCNKDGCLTVGDRSTPRPDLLFRDRDHLTESGSKVLIAHVRSQLFGAN